ncbi:MAG: hypothetical protein GF393_00175 [Armatimonadia bacterium]|nr:hypothetical protein [Armatimonadia bacterium]
MLQAELVGVPIKAITYGNSHGVLATGPEGRQGMFYIGSYATTGGQLLGYHSESGELVRIPLTSDGCYGLAVAPDGALYAGGVGPGHLMRLDPESGAVIDLGNADSGASYIWDCDTDSQGRVYGACYPTAGVVQYDPASGEMRDLGSLNAERKYARSLCVDAHDRLWVGLGMPPELWVVEPDSGERRQVLPEEFMQDSSVYELQRSGPYVCASVLLDGGLLVYDAATEQVLRHVECPDGTIWWMLCAGAPAGGQYLYTFPDGHLYHYDIEADELTLLAESLGQCEVVADSRYVHAIDDEEYVLYDLDEGRELDRRKLTEATEGMRIQTLVGDRNGNIFGSTYINQHMFGLKPGGELRDLGKVIRAGGQVDSMHAGRDGRIYMGSYVRAHLSIYDPSLPWSPGTSLDSNPRELGEVGQGQYRTTSIVLGPDDRIWVGSIPSYNSAATGAFSVWDPVTGEHRSWLDLVPGGAVSDIATGDRYLYCAGGGLFFVWDPIAEEKVHEETNMPVSALAVAHDGSVVICTRAELVFFDPAAMVVTERIPSPIGALSQMTVASDGAIYGSNPEATIRILPDSREAQKIADDGGKLIATDADGTIFLARDAQLWRLR